MPVVVVVMVVLVVVVMVVVVIIVMIVVVVVMMAATMVVAEALAQGELGGQLPDGFPLVQDGLLLPHQAFTQM